MDRFVIRTNQASNSTIQGVSGGNSPPAGQPCLLATGDERNFASTSTAEKINDDHPDDLAQKGEPIKQIKLCKYPKNKDRRSFRSEWFEHFEWLEYSSKLDAAFCYPCRQFVPFRKEQTYTKKGFKNWKAALDKSKAGFYKHASSKTHLQAMLMWSERNKRLDSNESIYTLINDNVLEKLRYYVASIVEIMQFLVVNELPMRGTHNIEEHVEECLYKNHFQCPLKKDTKLVDSYKIIPENAIYQFPEIQDEIVKIMTDLVQEEVSNDINNADVPFFTLLEDGTKDNNRRESIAIAARFVKGGEIYESMLSIETTTALEAEAFANTTLDTLRRHGLDPKNMLSQCYDGASVMSGKEGGVQALIQEKLKKRVPYVHCFSHRLHSVVVKAVEAVSMVREFFGQCAELYSFLSRGIMAAQDPGKTLFRLLERKCSGHLHVCGIIFEEYHHITETLELISINNQKRFDGEDVALSAGLHIIMQTQEFRFCLVVMKNVWEILSPADQGLQSHGVSLEQAYNLIQATKSSLEDLRNSETLQSILEETSKFATEEEGRRKRKFNPLFDDYVATETAGSRTSREANIDSEYALVFFEILDLVLAEIKRRFQDNEDILQAIIAAENLEYGNDQLNYLKNFNIIIPSKEEMKVAKHFLEKNNIEKRDFFSELYKYRSAFEDSYSMLAAVRTFGCSTAVCESTFSALTQSHSPQRLSTSRSRMANLMYLAFEQRRTKNLDVEKVVRRFNLLKERIHLD